MKAVLHFEVTELVVRTNVLGMQFEIGEPALPTTIELPSGPTSFGMGEPGGAAPRATRGLASPNVRAHMADVDVDIEIVDFVRVEVTLPEHPLRVAALLADHRAEPNAKARELLQQAVDGARNAVARFVSMLRTDGGQFWLGTSHVTPRPTWRCSLLDDDGNRFPIGVPVVTDIYGYSEENALTADALSRCAARAAAREQPKASHLLLADAAEEARVRPMDARRAVLFAAIAAETHIKQALLASASQEQLPVVELLLSSPRDFSLMAAALYDRTAAVVLGESAKAHDREMYKRIIRLFEVRNALAHRNAAPTDDEAFACVTAAREAIAWVDAALSRQRSRRSSALPLTPSP